MTDYLSETFREFLHGEYIAHLYNFSVDDHFFIMVFTEIDINDINYHAFRNEEAGFHIPAHCFDVKFDRVDNFENETYFQPPPKGKCSRKYSFPGDLSENIERIITLHLTTYKARAYFAVAETQKLKRYYDRVLQQRTDHIVYKATNGHGEKGMGYVLRTRYFSS
ncbi:hypothetical protein J1779_20850 [Rahnella sp. FC061912-K]|uniref:hypothetical protein n=1 Tax=Rahnella rivi TaxID=2816249 RepID=UPI001C254079|nr:hypothetical protein [Rahnella rivi]MBU9832385.1 hypothetical protein [Rahnella rivi]